MGIRFFKASSVCLICHGCYSSIGFNFFSCTCHRMEGNKTELDKILHGCNCCTTSLGGRDFYMSIIYDTQNLVNFNYHTVCPMS